MTREEAINEIKSWAIPSKNGREVLETLIPELAESEDERIRKELIGMIKACTNWAHKKEYIAYLEKQKESLPISEICKENANSFTDGIIEVRSFQRGMEEGRRLEKQKENPKSADSIPSDCTAGAKCEDRWHKVVDSLPDNPREVLCKDEAGNYFIGRYYVGEGWEISNYDDEDKPHHLNPPVSKWIDFPSEKQKEHKPQTDDEKEYIRTIKSIISDFIRDKKPENLAYYQRIYDWLDGRHVPFSCGHEKGQPADPVFSKQEYESHPIVSEDTTSAKPGKKSGEDITNGWKGADLDRYLSCLQRLGTGNPQQPETINSRWFREHCRPQSKQEWSEDIIRKAVKEVGLTQHQINWFETNVFPPKKEWSEEDEHIANILEFIVGENRPDEIFKIGNKQGISAYKMCSWLKHLPERFNPQPKQDWSKEDEEMRCTCIDLLEHFPRPCGEVIGPWKDCIAWLKSLHPQPKTKCK